uniref:Uncharacterized protein n=1 Tax=Schistocephalus solidus TaxID=70667 RepID=A0A0X3NQW4_SCHSO
MSATWIIIFAVASDQNDISALMDVINQAHPPIQFTLAQEQFKSLPVLDVLLSRSDGSVRFSVYRKKTWSGQYNHFGSFVSLNFKRNLVRCLIQWAKRIYSSLQESLRLLKSFSAERIPGSIFC